jgi:DNA-directed RNA polymerase specialized sigma24 family protein
VSAPSPNVQVSDASKEPHPHNDLSPYHFKRVLGHVQHHLPSHYDREQIALDILVESWLNDQPLPTSNFIHHRCIDAARSQQKESQVMRELSRRVFDAAPEHPTDARERVAKLVKCLDPVEKRAIAFRFYMDMPVAEAAKQCKMPEDAFRLVIQRALYKMREASV